MGWASRLNAGAARTKAPRVPGYRAGAHVRFRPLERRDVPQIYRWFDHDRAAFWNQQTWTMQSFYDLVENEHHYVYAVLRGGFLAGFGKLSWLDRDAGVLTPTVIVDPSQRDAGLGKAIVIELVTTVAQKLPHCTEVRGGVYSMNSAGVALATSIGRFFGMALPALSTGFDGRQVQTWSLPIRHRLEPRRPRVMI